MTRALLSAVVLGCLSGAAAADSHHQILKQESIVDAQGEVIGFRAHVLVDPQGHTTVNATYSGDVRLGLGSMQYTGLRGNPHRDANAGVQPGYILHQLTMRAITGPNPTDRGAPTQTFATGGQAKEVEVEVLYKDAPLLKPGMKVDLVAAFWKSSYWHPWGAVASATTSTTDFVVDLPGLAPGAPVPPTPAAPTPVAAPPIAPPAPVAAVATSAPTPARPIARPIVRPIPRPAMRVAVGRP